MQALERLYPPKAAIPGFVERQEAHYIRHGTQTLIANFEVATGRILAPTLGPTRSEEDFADHVLQTLTRDLDGEWIFIVDNLNTHQSESLVHLVTVLCDLKVDLGQKGRRGILRSCATRAAFLADGRHRIRFVYTPKRTSWLNQIELWFSILGPPSAETRQLRLDPRAERAGPGLHRILQSHPGQAVPMDLHGPSLGGRSAITCTIYAARH